MNAIRIAIIIAALFLVSGCREQAGTKAGEPIPGPSPIPTITSPTPTPLPEPTATATDLPDPVEYNFLLLGTDHSTFRSVNGSKNISGTRTDTIIIASYTRFWGIAPYIKFVSLPRDLLVEVPCSPHEMNRINTAYVYGGIDCVRETFLINFDLEIDYVVLIGMQDFVRVIDNLGDLSITPETDVFGSCGDVVSGNLAYDAYWRSGQSYEMSGNDLLCYVRGRDQAGDLDRNRKALEVIGAMVDQYPAIFKDDPVRTIQETWDFLSAFVETDLRIGDVIEFIPEVSWLNSVYFYKSYRLTLDELKFSRTSWGASVLEPTIDLEAWLADKLR
jgi:LCP family protein required for cell wall assembly